MDRWVIGWKLSADARDALLQAIPPAYGVTVADHVTLRSKVSGTTDPPPDVDGEIVGVADDGHGVQALVMRIDGATDRPGGGAYHVTWSLAPGRAARESNDVIARLGWSQVAPALTVRLRGARFL
jgi:hypothetical protein